MFKRIYRYACVGAVLAMPLVAVADSTPPPPNPAEPVNYIEWINRAFGGNIADNAYDTYRKAYELITPFDRGSNWEGAFEQPWTDNKTVSDWLTANRKALDTFREAARKSDCFFPLQLRQPTGEPRMDSSLMSVILPLRLRDYRSAVKGLIAEGYRAWAQGDRERLPKECVAVLRSAHHLYSDPTRFGRLIGISGAFMSYDALTNALRLSDDPDKLATGILPELVPADPEAPPYADACRFERLRCWDICQRLFVPASEEGTWTIHASFGKALGRTWSPESRVPLFGSAELARLAEIGFDQTLNDIEAYFDALKEWSTVPYYKGAKDADQIDQMIAGSQNPFMTEFLPSLTRARNKTERLAAQRRATHLIVHLFAHRAKTGKFPKKLRRLDVPSLNELRMDPFSGKDFKYKRTRDGFKLYSVSGNLKDNKGAHDPGWENGDYVFWPVQE